MRPLTAGLGLALLCFFVPSALADVSVYHHGDGPITSIIAVTDDAGDLQTHQDMALTARSSDLRLDSATLHDHDGFFWMLSQGEGDLAVEARSGAGNGKGTSATTYAPRDGFAASVGYEGRTVHASPGDDGAPITAFCRVTQDGHLIAWGATRITQETDLVHVSDNWGAVDVTVLALDGQAAGHTAFKLPMLDATPGPIQPILDLLADPDEQAPPAAACTSLAQEPAGDWFEETHVRLTWDPLANAQNDHDVHVTYRLFSSTNEELLSLHVADPVGHALLRAPAAGAYTLVAETADQACSQPVTVKASNGQQEAIWSAEPRVGGFDVTFDMDSATHYDVEAVVWDEARGRLLYAGKLHSHSQGSSAAFDVPPGDYRIDLYPVAQGEGPTITGALSARIDIVDGAAESVATPATGPWLLLVFALLVARQRIR